MIEKAVRSFQNMSGEVLEVTRSRRKELPHFRSHNCWPREFLAPRAVVFIFILLLKFLLETLFVLH